MAEKRLLFSSIDNGYTYKDYKEYCEDYNMEVGTEWSWDYLNWKNEMTEEDWECTMANIKYSKNNGRCIVAGALGLWDGRRTIKERVFDSLIDAINAINTNDYIEIYEGDGEIEVRSIHHDGTNIFTIRPIGKRGDRKSNDEIEESNNPMWFATKYPKYIY